MRKKRRELASDENRDAVVAPLIGHWALSLAAPLGAQAGSPGSFVRRVRRLPVLSSSTFGARRSHARLSVVHEKPRERINAARATRGRACFIADSDSERSLERDATDANYRPIGDR